jgi:hypothetical protein
VPLEGLARGGGGIRGLGLLGLGLIADEDMTAEQLEEARPRLEEMGILSPSGDESVMLEALLSQEEEPSGLFERVESSPWGFMRGAPDWLANLVPGGGLDSEGVADALEGQPLADGPPLVPSHDPAEQAQLVQQLKDAAFKDGLGYTPAPEPLSQFDKGIAVEEIPSEKLKRIRAQAKMKGAAGSLRAPTPEDIDTSGISDTLEPRLLTEVRDLGPLQTTEALEQYVAGGPYREALSNLQTREIYERDPQAVDRAEQLLGLGREMRYAQRQKAVDAMVDAVSGISGTIPFEMVQKLTMLDPQAASMIPEEKIGLSRSQVQNQLYKEMENAEELAQALAGQFLVGGDNRIMAINRIRAATMRANQQINSPGADPTQIWNDYMQTVLKIRNEYAPTEAFGSEEQQEEYRVE